MISANVPIKNGSLKPCFDVGTVICEQSVIDMFTDNWQSRVRKIISIYSSGIWFFSYDLTSFCTYKQIYKDLTMDELTFGSTVTDDTMVLNAVAVATDFTVHDAVTSLFHVDNSTLWITTNHLKGTERFTTLLKLEGTHDHDKH